MSSQPVWEKRREREGRPHTIHPAECKLPACRQPAEQRLRRRGGEGAGNPQEGGGGAHGAGIFVVRAESAPLRHRASRSVVAEPGCAFQVGDPAGAEARCQVRRCSGRLSRRLQVSFYFGLLWMIDAGGFVFRFSILFPLTNKCKKVYEGEIMK